MLATSLDVVNDELTFDVLNFSSFLHLTGQLPLQYRTKRRIPMLPDSSTGRTAALSCFDSTICFRVFLSPPRPLSLQHVRRTPFASSSPTYSVGASGGGKPPFLHYLLDVSLSRRPRPFPPPLPNSPPTLHVDDRSTSNVLIFTTATLASQQSEKKTGQMSLRLAWPPSASSFRQLSSQLA